MKCLQSVLLLILVILLSVPIVTLGAWQEGYSGPGTDKPVLATCTYDGNLVIAGQFNTVNSTTANGIALYDGESWHTLGGGLDNGDNSQYSRVTHVVQYGDRLIATCKYIVFPTNRWSSSIAQWNGASWSPLGEGLTGEIHGMCVHEGELYVCGDEIIEYNGIHENLAIWNGDFWYPVPSANLGPIMDLVFIDGNKYALCERVQADDPIPSAVVHRHNCQWVPVGELTEINGDQLEIFNETIMVKGDWGWASRLYQWDGAEWTMMLEDVATSYYCMKSIQGRLILSCFYSGLMYEHTYGYVHVWDGDDWVSWEPVPS